MYQTLLMPLTFTMMLKLKEGLCSSPFTTIEQQQVQDIFATCKDFCIQTLHKAAYILDPRYDGVLFNHYNRITTSVFYTQVG